MRKIKTIFKRNENTRVVVDELDVCFDFEHAIATEKVDGTNVRVTVRNHECVRLEKRRNPSKIQKKNGIIEPWYVDADRFDKADKYIFDALDSTDLSNIPDGEWSAEAYGEKIQGNPLNINGRKLFFFSYAPELMKAVFENVPTDYFELKKWIKDQNSKIGNGKIEGIVWHNYEDMVKIKVKDFK